MGVSELLAGVLDRAERERAPVEPLTEARPRMTLADAYAVQRAGRSLREGRGATVVGHKVGLTSVAMQRMLGVEQPDFGYLTDAMVLEDGVAIDAGELIEPRVEAEIAFRLRAPLRGPGCDREAVLAATEAVAPALEVIDSRVAEWRITIVDTIADNASSARVVLGAFTPVRELGRDLADVSMTMRVAAERAVGSGQAVLGHPAEAVAWLVRALSAYGGEGLEPGHLVLPGAMAGALGVASGDRVEARFEGLGAVGARFVAEPSD